MIRTIIADNEVWVCRLIESLVNWEDFGFTVIDRAYDGETLLEMIEHTKPDLVITDIQMPVKNGIEVIRQIRRHDLSTAVIIVSGYDDFAYAQAAIDLDISAYLLKPLETETLMNALLAVKKKLLHRQQSQQTLSTLQLQLRQSHRQHLNLYVKSLLHGDALPLPLDEVNAQFDRQFAPGLFRVLLVSADPQTPSAPARSDIFRYLDDLLADLYRTSCFDLFYMELTPFYLILLNYDEANDRLMCSLAHQLLHNGAAFIPSVSSYALTLGIGLPVSALCQVSNSYQAAHNAIHARTQLGERRVIDGDTYTQPAPSLSKAVQNRIAGLVNSYLAEDDFEPVIEQIFQETDSNAPPYAAYERARMAFNAAYEAVPKAAQAAFDKQYSPEQLCLSWEQAGNKRQLKRLLKELLGALQTQSRQAAAIGNLIDIVKDYIDRHLEQDVSLNDLAELVHFNPNYLSEMFKKETGETFVKYLTFKRMAAAKRYLADQTLRISNIAAMVGYKDANYFNRVFKNHVGVTPKQYRKLFMQR